MVEGKLVTLEYDSLAGGRELKDRYKRTLAYVFLQDGMHLNEEIIKQGYGFAVSRVKYKTVNEAEKKARKKVVWETIFQS